MILGVLGERFFGFKLGRRQWIGVTLTATGLAFLAVSGESKSGQGERRVLCDRDDRVSVEPRRDRHCAARLVLHRGGPVSNLAWSWGWPPACCSR